MHAALRLSFTRIHCTSTTSTTSGNNGYRQQWIARTHAFTAWTISLCSGNTALRGWGLLIGGPHLTGDKGCVPWDWAARRPGPVVWLSDRLHYEATPRTALVTSTRGRCRGRVEEGPAGAGRCTTGGGARLPRTLPVRRIPR